MMDYNILNRGSFNEQSLKFNITSEPNNAGVHIHKLLGGGTFCIKHASWRYSVGAGQIDPYGWPRAPMEISINEVLNRQTASPYTFDPPKLLHGQIEVNVKNPSTLKVTVHMTLTGVVMTPKEGEPQLSPKEILGYSLLDDSQKGMMALSEAAIDRVDDHFRQLGMGSLRDQMLGGQVGTALQMLPDNLRHLAFPALMNNPELLQQLDAQPHQTETPALTTKDPSELRSLLIGDLVTFKGETPISLEDIQKLSDYLLDKGWMK